MKGSRNDLGPFSLLGEMEVVMVRAKTPRMVEARFVFQTVPVGADKAYAQFDVAFFRRDGKLRMAFGLAGEGGRVENVDVTVLEVMMAAVEAVRERVKLEELHEQAE